MLEVHDRESVDEEDGDSRSSKLENVVERAVDESREHPQIPGFEIVGCLGEHDLRRHLDGHPVHWRVSATKSSNESAAWTPNRLGADDVWRDRIMLRRRKLEATPVFS